MPDFSFLARLTTSLQNLFGGQAKAAEPLKVHTPISQDAQNEAERMAKRREYIRRGYQLPNMTPEEQTLAQTQPLATPTQAPTATPTPEPTAAPGISPAMEFFGNQMPPSQQGTVPIETYYPLLNNPEFVKKVKEADKLRQGLSDMLLLQAFFESTLGRSSDNPFGVLPGGEGAGVNPNFQSPVEALDYQLGPNVMGGGANPNMNILKENTPLTPSDVKTFYSSYDPHSAYLDQLLKVLFPQQ